MALVLSCLRSLYLRKIIFPTFTVVEMGEEKFPEVQGGGSLILAWQIRNKRVLVVGGGEASLFNDSM
jgi:hypothetical protein